MPNVNVSYQEMQAQASRLQSGRQDIESRLAALQNEVRTLIQSGFSTDSASGQFNASYEEFSRGARTVIEGLDGMANYLTKAAAAFQTVDAELARAIA